jgi:hypothetical protein
VIAPASEHVSRDQARSAPALNGSVIAPAPSSVTREVSPSRVQMNKIAVVPPPVSAPERESSRIAKLNLPAPSVVAPPPSADSPRDFRRLESGGVRSSAPNVIPPPPTQAANGSFVSSIIGKLFGTQDVVPPPPSVSCGKCRRHIPQLRRRIGQLARRQRHSTSALVWLRLRHPVDHPPDDLKAHRT